MESFVLNLFSDQLSRIIYNFHQSQINANFLSGKGSITNVKLNVGLINDLLRPTVPFLEFTEITLSELRVEVTSYTNLKKAPIVLVIEEIHAKAREPLEYHVDSAANAEKQKPKNDGTSSPPRRTAAAPQQYGLLHRIVDNLSVKIKCIHLSFSSLGKFKTRRRGAWTPPTLQVSFDNVEWICVTEGGNPGTPEAVWAHNELSAQQSRFKREASAQHRHRSYIIYKRLSMLCNVKLLPAGDEEGNKGLQFHTPKASEAVSNLISDTKVDVHLAYIRRLRDACVTGADLDVQVHGVDINLDVASYDKTSAVPTGCDVGAFLHMLVGLLHCYYKDRSFVDPLLPKGVKPAKSGGAKGGLLRGFGAAEKGGVHEEEEAEVGPDEFLPEVALLDDDLESSDESDYEDEPDEEHDEAYLAWKREQDTRERTEEVGSSAQSEQGEEVQLASAPEKERDKQQLPIEPPKQSEDGIEIGTASKMDDDQAPVKSYKRKRKAVIVVASGAQKFEKLSASLSIPRINMKLCLPNEAEMESRDGESADSESSHHCLELLLEGLVAECIWPKNREGDMGGHIQGSIKYLHLLESAYRKGWGAKSGTFGPKPWNVVRMFPLLRIGTRLFQGHDAFALSPKLKGNVGAIGFSKCDEFPMMENRETTWTWDRRIKGPRALAFKSTISFVDETLTRWSRTNVQHEASLGQLEVVLDSAPIERLVNLFSNPGDKDNKWFDARWFSGDWHAEIPLEILASDDAGFSLKDHLQPLPSLYPKSSKQSPLSSELRSVTAHFDSVTVRLPNPKHDLSAFRMADVVFNVTEATVLVSSDLPSSFLSGTITPDASNADFPHDPSDVSCITSTQQTDMDRVIFRLQISLTDCSLRIVPAYAWNQDEQFGNVLLPTNVTMMMSLESEPSLSGMEHKIASQSLVFSVLVHQFDSNIELRSAYCALETINCHFGSLIRGDASSGRKSIRSTSKPTDVEASNSFSIICIHVPEVKINVWGERASESRLSLEVNESKTGEARLKYVLLCRVKAALFEFGMDFTTKVLSPSSTPTHGSIFKCSFPTVSIEVCTRTGGEGADLEMVEILSMAASSRLVDSATAFCFPGDEVVGRQSNGGFLLRSEKVSTADISSTAASAVEIASPLVVDLNINAIQFFLNRVLECLLAPVFVGSANGISQTPLGSAIWSVVMGFVVSPPSGLVGSERSDVGPSLFRMSAGQVLLLIPSEVVPFGLFFNDVDLAVGDAPRQTDLRSTNYQHVVEKQCGHGGRTWRKGFCLLEDPATTEESSSSFYVLKGTHVLLRVASSQNAPEFTVILPQTSINWSSPVGLGGASVPPFDVTSLTELGLVMMAMGMPLSSLYFKLYKLSPDNETDQSAKLAIERLHNEIGGYHCKVSSFVGQMNAEINRLREAVFSKESERVAALTLASSTAAGWVRVSEELSFSHRIFTSATFWRYWLVIDRCLLILSKAPGARPSFIIPLRASTQLRSLSMSSSSNRSASGIVGKHVRAKGFALFDSEIRLFFVAFNDSDHNMWVNAISMALGKEDASTDDDAAASATDTTAPHPSSIEGSIDVQPGPPLGALGGGSHEPVPPQAPNFYPPRPESSVPAEEPVAPTPAAATPPSPTEPLDSFESMEDVNMEDVSLVDENAPSADLPVQQPSPVLPPVVPAPAAVSHTQEPQSADKQQPLPMRERLALAKGKSKMASARFGSVLKTAKGGVLAASEIGRDGIKQAMAKEAPHKDEMARRSVAVGQKMSLLKQNASTRLAVARTAVQVQMNAEAASAPALSLSSSRDELSRKKAAVGQKLSSMKLNAGEKLHALSTSESVTSTRRRLDGTIAAVKSGVKNDPMVRSLSQSRHSESSRQRLGLGEETKSVKPVKFDARETFAASSELPLKLKNASIGDAVFTDKDVTEALESLEKLDGTWVVSVDAVRAAMPPSADLQIKPSSLWKYNIAATDISADDVAQESVERTMPEVLLFHATISEIMAKHLPSTAIAEVIAQDGNALSDSPDPLLKRVSPLERLRVSGTLLQQVLEVDAPSLDSNSSILRKNQCRSIKVFISTLLECRIPHEAAEATKIFLGMDDNSSSDAVDEYGTYLTNGSHYLDEAFGEVSNALAESDKANQGNSLDLDARNERDMPLLNALMDAYTRAIKERDEALASLSTTSIMNDNRILQEQLARNNGLAKAKSSDEDMVQLCKQLGTEISLRTAAETEINRLNERLEFERKVAEAKENELRAELRRYQEGPSN